MHLEGKGKSLQEASERIQWSIITPQWYRLKFYCCWSIITPHQFVTINYYIPNLFSDGECWSQEEDPYQKSLEEGHRNKEVVQSEKPPTSL